MVWEFAYLGETRPTSPQTHQLTARPPVGWSAEEPDIETLAIQLRYNLP